MDQVGSISPYKPKLLIPLGEIMISNVQISRCYTVSIVTSNLSTALKSKSDKWVGWVQNFITYKQMKGQERRESVTKKAKEKGKGAIEPPLNKGADVIIYIGLVTWSEKCGCLKNKHGKRLALRVNTKDSATTILQKAVSKWKAFYSDCYIED